MNTSIRYILVSSCILAALAVASGAFGTHTLQNSITPERLATFETGSYYLLVHSIAVLITCLFMMHLSHPLIKAASLMLLTGSAIFAGSLFILVLLDLPIMGAVTPIGGLLMIGGWICLGIGLLKSRSAD